MPKIEYQKTQTGRLWSIFGFSVLLLIVAGMPVIPNFLRAVLIIMGVATILSIAPHYLKNVEVNK